MNFRSSFLLAAVLPSAIVSPAAADAQSESALVTVGVRKTGAGGGDGLPEMAPATRIDLDSLPLVEVERFDAQYGSPGTFTGVPLEALIARIQVPTHADLALLHFANGVVVPLAYRDRAVMKRLQPFVARGMHLPDSGMTLGKFRPVTSAVRGFLDVPLIEFAGNKLVVAERWHPDVPARAERDLSPWVHVDSLVAIELVNAAAYTFMFPVVKKTAPGLALFRESCQFCHGVRQVGAKFGMDFVDPVPVHQWPNIERRFYWHVRYRHPDPLVRGEMMPALKYMSEREAAAVWSWLRSAAEQPLRPYRPERSAVYRR
jgi:mono/diheme cytochrome c family protein